MNRELNVRKIKAIEEVLTTNKIIKQNQIEVVSTWHIEDEENIFIEMRRLVDIEIKTYWLKVPDDLNNLIFEILMMGEE